MALLAGPSDPYLSVVPGLRAPEATEPPSHRAPEAPAHPPAAPHRGAAIGVAAGSAAMVCVGGSVAVSSVLAGAPVYTAEALRYGAACLLLVALARLTGRRITWPRKRSGCGCPASP